MPPNSRSLHKHTVLGTENVTVALTGGKDGTDLDFWQSFWCPQIDLICKVKVGIRVRDVSELHPGYPDTNRNIFKVQEAQTCGMIQSDNPVHSFLHKIRRSADPIHSITQRLCPHMPGWLHRLKIGGTTWRRNNTKAVT